MAKPDSQWYRLDNAGILYSALQREDIPPSTASPP